jgi:hypothetical protein
MKLLSDRECLAEATFFSTQAKDQREKRLNNTHLIIAVRSKADQNRNCGYRRSQSKRSNTDAPHY